MTNSPDNVDLVGDMSWTQEEADKAKAPNDRPRPVNNERPQRLALPRRPIMNERAREHQIAARIAAVSAASRMYEGGFLRHEIDIDEFLATAQDLEEWINRA